MTPRLVGMVHLGSLPGSPGYQGDLAKLTNDAIADATLLESAGFDAILVENFGDAPFFADDVPKATVAAMTRVIGEIVERVSVPVGVNVLRNDALAALAVAAATAASFIRVNVLSGSMYTDQGLITGRAADVARLRAQIASSVRVFADVFVKHATPPPGMTIDGAARDTVERGGADAVIVSGAATGSAPALDLVRQVADAVHGTPVLVGSGVTTETVGDYLRTATGIIVGTSIKQDGVTTNPIDVERATDLVAAASAYVTES